VTSPAPLSAHSQPSRRAAVLWWVLLVRAVLVLALGVVFLASGRPRPILGNLIAGYWLLGAVVTLRWARVNRGQRGFRLAAVAGVLGVVVACAVLARGLVRGAISLDAALTLLGISFVVTGTLRTLGGFRDHPAATGPPQPVPRLLLGITEVAVGVVFIHATHVDRGIAISAGLWALIGGALMMWDALRSRRQALGGS
jgi:uncharacterized membrane protein HdeD (DUF308 family)